MNKLIVFLFMFMETSMPVTSCSTAHQQSSSFTRPLRRVIPTRRLGMWTIWQTCNRHWGVNFSNEGTTGIYGVKVAASGEDSPCYTLSGQRVKILQRGIYVSGGKKILK